MRRATWRTMRSPKPCAYASLACLKTSSPMNSNATRPPLHLGAHCGRAQHDLEARAVRQPGQRIRVRRALEVRVRTPQPVAQALVLAEQAALEHTDIERQPDHQQREQCEQQFNPGRCGRSGAVAGARRPEHRERQRTRGGRQRGHRARCATPSLGAGRGASARAAATTRPARAARRWRARPSTGAASPPPRRAPATTAGNTAPPPCRTPRARCTCGGRPASKAARHRRLRLPPAASAIASDGGTSAAERPAIVATPHSMAAHRPTPPVTVPDTSQLRVRHTIRSAGAQRDLQRHERNAPQQQRRHRQRRGAAARWRHRR